MDVGVPYPIRLHAQQEPPRPGSRRLRHALRVLLDELLSGAANPQGGFFQRSQLASFPNNPSRQNENHAVLRLQASMRPCKHVRSVAHPMGEEGPMSKGPKPTHTQPGGFEDRERADDAVVN